MKFYILDNKIPKAVRNKLEWEKWMFHFEASCIISETVLNGNIVISTSFLGCSSEEEPLLFKTVIVGGLHDGYSKKNATWKKAENEHKCAVAIVLAELN